MEPTTPHRHEPGRITVPLVHLPRKVLHDNALSFTARGLLLEALGSETGRTSLVHAAFRATENVQEILDAATLLVHLGYGRVEDEQLVLTPLADWTGAGA